ncbi:CBM20 domain-containing protein [Pedobacter rhizosphaerae]|uniref:Uncharacterized protein n=1 Tax=Pedobacter rhizosphaerae TaxID=390241 RepID=A0A1H9VQH5_9SPHI|nr:hypothetical protein [Pedobacter rhizosphaerae]SES23493.1 hypothetical protein SAMN04488023_14621 [Pedobacter rhizosphaerae]
MEQEKIDKLIKLKVSLEAILGDIDKLGGWDAANAYKLSRLNDQRHSLEGEIVGLGLITPLGYTYGSDETDRDISIAQSSTKKKSDIAINTRKYNSGYRNLKYEIGTYIDSINAALPKDEA